MSYSNRCPPACPPYPLCTVAPIINSRVYGSGRLFQPYPLAMQAPGYAYIDGDQNPASPLLPCGPPCGPNGAVPRAPDGFTTDVVGAGILSPVRWRGAGVFADNYALPGDIAREPNEGWWASETIDADTGKRSWITGMSGLGGLGAFSIPSWFNNTFFTIAGVRIPNWLGYGVLAFVAYKIAKKKGLIKNRRRWSAAGAQKFRRNHCANGRRRRNGFEPPRPARHGDESLATELELFIANDGDLYRQQGQYILKNLATKVARGQYDHAKAVKRYMYLMESGAKKYAREHGGGEAGWHAMFPVPVRKIVAETFTKEFEVENGLGNYKHLLPKKYQPKANRRSRRRARQRNGGTKRLTASGWFADWVDGKPRTVYLRYEGTGGGKRTWDGEVSTPVSQSAIRYDDGRIAYDYPEQVPSSVKEKVRALYASLARGKR